MPTLDSLRDEYQQLFDTCQIDPAHLGSVDQIIAIIVQNRPRYETVGTPLGIPWYFIGAIHSMESSLNFQRHLHNGDPLTDRTVHVPAGRPVTGNPPFTWEESATDALTIPPHQLNEVTDWTLPGTLYQIERYNGFGYRKLDPQINTPYLWSWSNQYASGKYVADGVFDPDAVSQQSGAAVILRRMVDQAIISIDDTPATPPDPKAAIAALAPQVTFSTTTASAAAKALQHALNQIPGIALHEDGVPGPATSAALETVTGQFLAGDPRAQGQAVGG